MYKIKLTQVQIIQLNEARTFEKKETFAHNYPPTKLLFNPEEVIV